MTTQQKLHAVETAIRKALPRLMEPTEGCLVIFRNVKNKKQSGKILYNFGQDFYRIFCKNESDEYLRRRNEVEILGHDILLSDVLEWLRLFNNDYCLWDGMLLKLVGASNYYAEFETINEKTFDENTIKLDLSKPYLKDQSEELINFLYNLIEQ